MRCGLSHLLSMYTLGRLHPMYADWLCWFLMNWIFPHMLIMLILDWLNGSSVQSRVPLLFCISTTPPLIWTQNQTLANSIGVKSYPQRTLVQQNYLWIISLFFYNGCCIRILSFLISKHRRSCSVDVKSRLFHFLDTPKWSSWIFETLDMVYSASMSIWLRLVISISSNVHRC